MATYRLIHREVATGERSSSLDNLEFRVWVQYQLSADDFGVCVASAFKFQGDNTFLRKQPTRRVQEAIERIIASGLVGVFLDSGVRYLYQPDWQDWQRLKHATGSSLPPIPGETLEKCSPKTRKLFAEFHPKVGRTFPPHARGRDAHANANAHADAHAHASEGGPGETLTAASPPTSAGPPRNRTHESGLITTPLDWHRKHEAVHVTEFCDFVCFPNDLADSFAHKITGQPFEEARAHVLAWARTVRKDWQGRVIPDGNDYEFWRHRWTESHGGSKPAKGSGTPDPLGGLKKMVRRG